ncbi:MAG: hypothetical protein HRT57_17600 [Crocinitomicaceae bacterium]|nr:hypothetical protein [Crocinitomicaceae bacterium]
MLVSVVVLAFQMPTNQMNSSLILRVPEMVKSVGISVDHTIVFNNFFFGINMAYGFMLDERYILLKGQRTGYGSLHNNFIETGIFIGHKFKAKD